MNSNSCESRWLFKATLLPRTEPPQSSRSLAAIIGPNSCSADIENLFDTYTKCSNETIT